MAEFLPLSTPPSKYRKYGIKSRSFDLHVLPLEILLGRLPSCTQGIVLSETRPPQVAWAIVSAGLRLSATCASCTYASCHLTHLGSDRKSWQQLWRSFCSVCCCLNIQQIIATLNWIRRFGDFSRLGLILWAYPCGKPRQPGKWPAVACARWLAFYNFVARKT